MGQYWPPRMDGKKGKHMPWLVLFHSPSSMGCAKHEKECTRTRDRWEALAKKIPEVATAMVGAVDCDSNAEFCAKQNVGHMPFVRRYKSSKRKTFYGDWDIDAVMSFLLG